MSVPPGDQGGHTGKKEIDEREIRFGSNDIVDAELTLSLHELLYPWHSFNRLLPFIFFSSTPSSNEVVTHRIVSIKRDLLFFFLARAKRSHFSHPKGFAGEKRWRRGRKRGWGPEISEIA